MEVVVIQSAVDLFVVVGLDSGGCGVRSVCHRHSKLNKDDHTDEKIEDISKASNSSPRQVFVFARLARDCLLFDEGDAQTAYGHTS
jgi:hypothetical protein